jgi:hypothetical protein
LGAADLVACDTNVGRWLSGIVRFSSASPPDPAQGSDAPPAVAVSLALSGGAYPIAPECSTEAMKTVSYRLAGSLRVEAVPIGATPAAMGVPGWAETGERHVAYRCVVYPGAGGVWSGRATLVATGWSIGTAATERRVCRYTSDLDASSAIDANIEHPASYASVGSALMNQNFLVINGNETCPAGRAVQVAGVGSDVPADLSTAQHQP